MAALVFARHVVVDGSNIATEGRSMPSLAQLDEAVREYRREFPDDIIVVVVDATFGHRIEESERSAFDEAVAHNEIVSPPAGAIGRGDAFLLRIAEKVGATVLSNDSFQEFHGEYEWLFTNGRLIGGKPVPGVGWIFTPRTPVRGPRSRDAVRTAKRERGARRPHPDEVQKKVEKAIAAATEEVVEPDSPSVKRRRRRRGSAPPAEPVNEPLAFIELVAKYPLGSEIEGEVDTFSSHGAFVQAGGARCYIPLAALGDPPPRAAKDVLRKGETRTFIVQALDPSRRGVELALPEYAHIAGAPSPETVEEEIKRSRRTADDGPSPRQRGRGRRREEAPAQPGGIREDPYGQYPEQPAPAPGSMPEPSTAAAIVSEPGSERKDTEHGGEERVPARTARKRTPPRAAPPAPADTAPTKARSGRKAAASAAAPLLGESPPDGEESAPAVRKRGAAKVAAATAAPAAPSDAAAAIGQPAAPFVQKARPARRSRAKAPPVQAPDQTPQAEEAPPSGKAATAKSAAAKKSAAGRTASGSAKAAEKAPAGRRAAAKKAPADEAPAAAPAGKKAAATKKAPAEQGPAERALVEKAPSKKAAAINKAPAEKAPAKKIPASKAAKKTPAKKAPAKKAPAKKAPAKKAGARQKAAPISTA